MRTDLQDVLAPETKRYRTLFVSDLHLGTKACQAEAFLDFLRCSDRRHASIWSATSSTAGASSAAGTGRSRTTTWCRSCCARRAKGTRASSTSPATTTKPCATIAARTSAASIVRNAIHTGADGRRYLVIHGDQFDVVVRYARWLAHPRRLGLRGRALGSTTISTPAAAGSACPTGRCRPMASSTRSRTP